MEEQQGSALEKLGILMVCLMAALQAMYAVCAFVNPSEFAAVRGTALLFSGDADWVKIYASRTAFVALIIGYLLYLRSYKILAWAAIFGTVMPLSDAYLAFQANAADNVIYKHLATFLYLIITFYVLRKITQHKS